MRLSRHTRRFAQAFARRVGMIERHCKCARSTFTLLEAGEPPRPLLCGARGHFNTTHGENAGTRRAIT